MSLRHLKKIKTPNKMMPEGDESSGEDYEPLYAKLEAATINANAFAGISLTDSGTGKEESSDANESHIPETSAKQGKKKKAKKNKKTRRRACAQAHAQEDDVEESVMAVNALLGTPSCSVEENKMEDEDMDIARFKDDIRAVDIKHLNVDNELKKIFGPDPDSEKARNRGRVANLRRIQKQVIIDDSVYSKAIGLSMIMMQRKAGCNFFSFRHNKVYRDAHINFLKSTDHRFIDPMLPMFGEAFKHVEAQLEIADFFFLKEEYTIANNLIEKVIWKMESVFHPLFRLSDPNTRLEYKYLENRTFHVAMLKYIHLLTNRACHRTALELAKVLMNLDPTDPLAVIFIVDVLAVRAREFEWLIKAIDYWKKERSADEMFNMKYSLALAHFHVAKDKADMDKATELLQDALLSFPTVALHIMELANVGDASRLAKRALFNIAPPTMESTRRMRELYQLYAHFAMIRWREPEAMQWLVATANTTADLCDTDSEMQAKSSLALRRAATVLRAVPVEVQRHLCVIKPMSSLLVDGNVPIVPMTRMSDPLPNVAETIDRCGYMNYSSNYAFNPDRPYVNITSLPVFFRNSVITGIVGDLEDYPSSFFEDSDDDDSVDLN